jgi:restriction system protein
MISLRRPTPPPARLPGREIGLTVFGGALLMGALASLVDVGQVGSRVELAATAMLTAAYVACIGAVVRGWLRRHPRVRSIGEYLALTPKQFEAAVGDLLREIGFREVRHVGGAGDLGADLLCRDASGRKTVVQCKRYAPGKRVTSPAIQAFIGMATVHHRASHGVFVTTSDFTGPAVELAREHGLLLIDGTSLVALARGVDAGGAYQQATEDDNART